VGLEDVIIYMGQFMAAAVTVKWRLKRSHINSLLDATCMPIGIIVQECHIFGPKAMVGFVNMLTDSRAIHVTVGEFDVAMVLMETGVHGTFGLTYVPSWTRLALLSCTCSMVDVAWGFHVR
jgi:hypothetical protein